MRFRALILTVALGSLSALSARADGGAGSGRLQVHCTKGSAFVSILVERDHRIGKVVLQIRDQQGRVIYREEGKALTSELVRRLDKGQLPRGKHTLSVEAKDLLLSQEFTIE
jgi:hypothetical protein